MTVGEETKVKRGGELAKGKRCVFIEGEVHSSGKVDDQMLLARLPTTGSQVRLE
jgi:hypothetical protein